MKKAGGTARVLFILFLAYAPRAVAQVSFNDSLQSIVNSDRNDSTVLSALNALAWESFRHTQYPEALEYAKRLKEAATAQKNDKWIAASYNLSGAVLCEAGNFLGAADNFLQALRINEKRNDERAMGSNYVNLGIAQMYVKNFSKAGDYYGRAIAIAKKHRDAKGLVTALLNLALISRQEGKFDLSRKYYDRVIAVMDSSGYRSPLGHAYLNLGNLYEDLADSAHAKEEKLRYNALAGDMYRRSLPLADSAGDLYGICHLHVSMASVNLRAGNVADAEKYIRLAMEEQADIGSLSLLSFIHEVYATVLEKKGDHAGALNQYRLYKITSDSLHAEEKRRALVEKELGYEFEKKETILKLQAEKERVRLEAMNREQLLFTWIAIGGLVLAVLFGAVIFTRFRITRRQKELIEQQKKTVEEKNREIGDSIAYALHLQKAILPSHQHFSDLFTGHFIFYRPKDVVAGDFYWLEMMTENNSDWILLAVADATGHGVPGALVSVVCFNALNRCVKEFGLLMPGQILDKASSLVVETFMKSNTEVNDGMDISLLAIDRKTNTAYWAGANNPLCYTFEGDLKEIAADKQPVGKSYQGKPFTTHTIPLTPGMGFYLFTDGLADQFGGPLGKKFRHKQLRALLSEVSPLSMKRQEEAITTSFETWKNGHEQVDDVCMIGIRI